MSRHVWKKFVHITFMLVFLILVQDELGMSVDCWDKIHHRGITKERHINQNTKVDQPEPNRRNYFKHSNSLLMDEKATNHYLKVLVEDVEKAQNHTIKNIEINPIDGEKDKYNTAQTNYINYEIDESSVKSEANTEKAENDDPEFYTGERKNQSESEELKSPETDIKGSKQEQTFCHSNSNETLSRNPRVFIPNQNRTLMNRLKQKLHGNNNGLLRSSMPQNDSSMAQNDSVKVLNQRVNKMFILYHSVVNDNHTDLQTNKVDKNNSKIQRNRHIEENLRKPFQSSCKRHGTKHVLSHWYTFFIFLMLLGLIFLLVFYYFLQKYFKDKGANITNKNCRFPSRRVVVQEQKSFKDKGVNIRKENCRLPARSGVLEHKSSKDKGVTIVTKENSRFPCRSGIKEANSKNVFEKIPHCMYKLNELQKSIEKPRSLLPNRDRSLKERSKLVPSNHTSRKKTYGSNTIGKICDFSSEASYDASKIFLCVRKGHIFIPTGFTYKKVNKEPKRRHNARHKSAGTTKRCDVICSRCSEKRKHERATKTRNSTVRYHKIDRVLTDKCQNTLQKELTDTPIEGKYKIKLILKNTDQDNKCYVEEKELKNIDYEDSSKSASVEKRTEKKNKRGFVQKIKRAICTYK